MKKIISFILTLAMVMSLGSVSVFAADNTITSTDEGNNSVSQSVTADYTPDCEATWGTAENQSKFGTLTEAIAAAKDDSSITYIQLQDNLNLSNTIEITGGTFILDLNGKTITYAKRVIAVNGDNAKVTFADSASDGKVISAEEGYGAVGILQGEVTFSGGTYQGSVGLDIKGGKAVTINEGIFTSTADEMLLDAGSFAAISVTDGDVDLCINGGTFNGLYKVKMYAGSVTIKQGVFAGEEVATVAYVSGKLDLSGYTGKITKLTVYAEDSVSSIGDDNIKLPTGYGMSEDGSNVVTALEEGKKYSIISTTGENQDATITGVSVKVGSNTYTSGNVTLTQDSGDVTITVSGTNFSKLDAEDNKLLYAKGLSDGVSKNSGWTVNDENTEASKTFELSKFQNCTTVFEIKYSNEGDDPDKYIGSGIRIVYQNETVSVGITWGAMNFTYSDEQVDGSDKGWTCETGANTVKVENSGTKDIAAGISYTAESNYSNIKGTFDKTSKTIVKDGNAAFTLTLSGKPDAALSGTNIGTVTVTIMKIIDVASADDLEAALASGGYIKLVDSFEGSNFTVSTSTPVVLDLNGKNLTVTTDSGFKTESGSNVTINDDVGGGVITGKTTSGIACYGTLVINGGNYEGASGADLWVYNDDTDVTINDGTFGEVFVKKGTMTIKGGRIEKFRCNTSATVYITGGIVNVDSAIAFKGTIIITGGTFNLDPSAIGKDNIKINTTTHTVTDNGDGTWTVAEKQKNNN